MFLGFILYACLNPQTIVEAAKNGILIWFQQILPALLPFTILSCVLIRSHFLEGWKGNANLIAIALTLVCGFGFGFPIGAKLSADFYKDQMLSKRQALILSVATNNFSPMYVCGFALPFLFGTGQYHKITYLLLYFVPLFIATFFLILTYNAENNERKNEEITKKFEFNMNILNESILQGFLSLIKICGYIVFFSILAQIFGNLWQNTSISWNILLANLEITNGIQRLSRMLLPESIRYILAMQILSFGGISGIAQTASFLEDAGISVYKYIIGKVILSLLLTVLSAVYVFGFILRP